jgi:hypothetical protein
MAGPRYPSLDGSPGLISDPGFDQEDGLLAAVGGDGVIDPQEQQEVQRLMVGLQAIGQQRLAAMGMNDQPAPPANETSDFGATDGTEPTPDSAPQPGAEFTTRM